MAGGIESFLENHQLWGEGGGATSQILWIFQVQNSVDGGELLAIGSERILSEKVLACTHTRSGKGSHTSSREAMECRVL